MAKKMTHSQWSNSDFRIVIGSSTIDYDQNKNNINRTNHSYSLESAAYLLQRMALPIPSPLLITTDPFERNGEIRHNHMTKDENDNIVFFVTTMRPNETVRIISFRQASKEERKIYLAHENNSK